MEAAQNTIDELQRIKRIAYGKIPVSEESSVFNLFAQRRELCKVYNNSEEFTEYLKTIEDNIKRYLCL